MARVKQTDTVKIHHTKKITSQGKSSARTRITNKNQKRHKKKYNRQGTKRRR